MTSSKKIIIPHASEGDYECSACKTHFPLIAAFHHHVTHEHEEIAAILIHELEEKFIVKPKEKDEDEDDNSEIGQGESSLFQCKVCQKCFPTIEPLLEHGVSHLDLSSLDVGRGKEDYKIYFGQVFDNDNDDDDDESDDDDDDDESDDDDDDDESDESDEEGTEVWLTHKRLARICRSRADAALDFFNKVNPQGKRYGLVQQGPNMSSNFEIEHVNFKAKEKGRRDAPVETFFAQFRFDPGRAVECCLSLGPSELLPHWRKANLGGCKLCNGIIHHPTTPVDNLRLE